MKMENINKNQYFINKINYSSFINFILVFSLCLVFIILYFIAFFKLESYITIYGEVKDKKIIFLVPKEDLEKIYKKKLYINKKDIKYKIINIDDNITNYAITISISKKMKEKHVFLNFKTEQEALLKKDLNNLKGV